MTPIPQIFFREKLNNGITILCVDDSFIEYDLVVKINNYGSFLDTEIGIIGFQHLLEHCISYRNENNNIVSNASTTFSYMTVDMNLKDKYEESIYYLKKWFFKNGRMDQIDFSRDVSLNDIKNYIKLLENEYLFRETLDNRWSQELFFLTEQEYYYYGGNEKTMSGKEKEIKKALSSPYPIDTSDIVIIIKNSAHSFIQPIRELFENVKPVSVKKLKKSYRMSNIYNNVIENDRSGFKTIIFTIPKDEIDSEFVFLIPILLSGVSFNNNDNISEYYFELVDRDMTNLLKKLYMLEFMPEEFMMTFVEREIDSSNISFYVIDKISDKMWELIAKGARPQEYVNVFGKQIYNFISVLSKHVSEKKFVISSNINIYYQKKTKDGTEYNINPAKFSRRGIENIDIQYSERISMKTNKCSISGTQLLPVERFFNKDTSRVVLTDYYRSLLRFLLGNNTNTFNELLLSRLKNKVFRPYNNIKGLKLSNKLIHIVSEYNFIFICIKTVNAKKYDLTLFGDNMLITLRNDGLVYTWISNYLEEDNNGLITFCTIGKYKSFKEISNRVLANIVAYSYQVTYNIIISKEGLQNDFKELVVHSAVSVA